jgi:D-alanine-D-alanine ligase
MKGTVILICDIYPEPEIEKKELYQEWESKNSIEYLRDTLFDLGFSVEVYEPFRDKNILLNRLMAVINQNQRQNIILWNLVEGFYSRNREGYIPNLAEFLGFPYTGSDSYLQCITLDKDLTKSIANSLDIPTPKSYICASKDKIPQIPMEEFPLFAKPNFEGSSLGIKKSSILLNSLDLKVYIDQTPIVFFPILLEEYLPGDEYTLGIIGSKENVRTLRLCQVQVEGVYDEDSKSKNNMPEKIIPKDPANLRQIRDDTYKLADKLGFFGFGRADWKLDKEGTPKFLEINLTPGLSPFYSSFPISYGEGLASYKEMVKEILDISFIEYERVSRYYGREFVR